MRRLVFHPLARSDLFGLYTYIEDQSGAERAGGYVARIELILLSCTACKQANVTEKAAEL